VDAEFLDGETQLRVLRLRHEANAEAPVPREAIIATLLRRGTPPSILYDARHDPEFCAALLRFFADQKHYTFAGGEIAACTYPGFEEARGPDEVPMPITLQQ